MSSIFVFPGQGAQAVGMGKELYENNAAARAVFDEVDAALGEKLSDIIFNGPADTLTLTANVQPAIMATSIAMMRAANAQLPEFVAGHSLGEYTALCAAGALSVGDAAKLLRVRGNAMQSAVPVGMGLTAVILGLDIDAVREICAKTDCDVANDNSAGQVVISGAKEIVEATMAAAKEAGAKRAMPLALSVPVHCRMQQPAADAMKEALAGVKMNTPVVPIISNKTCTPLTNVDEIKEALVYQMTHGVRWRESVLAMADLGITEQIEVGPGSVLTGLCSRITDKITAKKLEI
ncbi:MAG: ACP S-malonyltransferase [Alphaproteobacteria bacterium]|jgi:[acyl-carrier-protein] S-malonyltransferase|nr:ACP S-malonyltransferase [Alphaproteobacteria bacterium]MBR2482890.1 ACP S-malonyltransferase [Alphaproteobacteria bacterium]